MEIITNWELEIDGVDKTGKDTLLRYLEVLSDYRYSVNVRGLVSQLAYNILYNRNREYRLEDIPKQRKIIYLTADIEDLKARIEITHEPNFDVEEHLRVFDSVVRQLQLNGFTILKFNTSKQTPYEIAKCILEGKYE